MVKMPHVNKKLARKQFLFTHHFLTLFKIRVKKSYAKKPLALLPNFIFWCDQKYHSNLTKIIQMCDDLKKYSAPIQIKFFEL